MLYTGMKELKKSPYVSAKISFVRFGSIAALSALEKNTGPSMKGTSRPGRIDLAEISSGKSRSLQKQQEDPRIP
jgi:hypothetical protein